MLDRHPPDDIGFVQPDRWVLNGPRSVAGFKAEDTSIGQEANGDCFASVDTANLVTMPANTHFTVVTDRPCPNRACQVGIDTLHIKELPLQVGMKRASRMTCPRMNVQRRTSCATSGLDRELVVVSLATVIQQSLQLLQLVTVLVLPCHIAHSAVTALHVWLVGGVSTATDDMFDPQADQPEGEQRGEATLRVTDILLAVIGLNLPRQSPLLKCFT